MEHVITRYKIFAPDKKKLNSLIEVLNQRGVPIFGANRTELWLSTGMVSEALEKALVELGCSLEEDRLDDDTCIIFPEKVDHRIGLAMNAMKDPNERVIFAMVRTTISRKEAEVLLGKYIWKPYICGLGSIFFMTLSVMDIEELVKEDWIRSIGMPHQINLQ